MSIMELLNKIIGSLPVPAGGAAVSYSACLAIGLLQKIVTMEIHKNADKPEMERNLLTAKREIERLLQDTERLVEEDPKIYLNFVKYLRKEDQKLIKQYFSNVVDISMKLIQNSTAGLEWAGQLCLVIPHKMKTHLLVSCEILMGSINGSIHLLQDNINTANLGIQKENYLKRLDQAHLECQKIYSDVMKKISNE